MNKKHAGSNSLRVLSKAITKTNSTAELYPTYSNMLHLRQRTLHVPITTHLHLLMNYFLVEPGLLARSKGVLKQTPS